MKRAGRVLPVVIATLVVACGGGSSTKATTATAATSLTALTAVLRTAGTTATPATTAQTASSTTTSGTATGVVAGLPFASGTQLVQLDTDQHVWRLHVLTGSHDCSDDLAALRPAVGIDWEAPASSPSPPTTGTARNGVGVVFVPARRTDYGTMTVSSGVEVVLERVESAPGGRWSGHLRVDPVTAEGVTFSFDGPIDALVCPPVAGLS